MNHNSLQCQVHGPFYEGRSARPVIRTDEQETDMNLNERAEMAVQRPVCKGKEPDL